MKKFAFSDKYKISEDLISKVSCMDEFANGAAQVNVELQNGQIYNEVLISNSSYIIAIRGLKVMPFSILDIKNIYQLDEDKNPKKRNDWDIFE